MYIFSQVYQTFVLTCYNLCSSVRIFFHLHLVVRQCAQFSKFWSVWECFISSSFKKIVWLGIEFWGTGFIPFSFGRCFLIVVKELATGICFCGCTVFLLDVRNVFFVCEWVCACACVPHFLCRALISHSHKVLWDLKHPAVIPENFNNCLSRCPVSSMLSVPLGTFDHFNWILMFFKLFPGFPISWSLSVTYELPDHFLHCFVFSCIQPTA